MDTNPFLDDLTSEIDRQMERARLLEQRLAEARSTASSPDGAVTLTVNPNGGLLNIQLGRRACELGNTKLADAIMTTLHKAQEEVAKKVVTAFKEIAPEAKETLDSIVGHIPYELDHADSAIVHRSNDDEFGGRPW